MNESSPNSLPPVFAQVQQRINNLIETGDTNQARKVLLQAAKLVASHPEASAWCRKTLKRITQETKTREQRNASDPESTKILARTAREFFDAADYEQAQTLLTSIPASERSNSVDELLFEVESILAELHDLEADLVDAVRREDLDEISATIDRLLELRPWHRLAKRIRANFGKIRRGKMLLRVGGHGEVIVNEELSFSPSASVWGLAAIALVGLIFGVVVPMVRPNFWDSSRSSEGNANGVDGANAANAAVASDPADTLPPDGRANVVDEAVIPGGNDLDALVNNFVDPKDGTVIVKQGGTLSMNVAPGVHDLSIELGKMNAPRSLESVSGDFTYVVRVENVKLPQAKSLEASRRAFVGAGILVWFDDRNYIRLERAALHDNLGSGLYANWELRRDGAFAREGNMGDMKLSAESTWLRVQRRGNQLLGAASEDGTNWTSLPPLNVNWPKDIQIGIVAINNTPVGYSANFDQRSLTIE